MDKQDWEDVRKTVGWASLVAFVVSVVGTLGFRLVMWLF